MSREIKVAVLPCLWALLATVIAVSLYKTSSALFEETQGKRRIRLTGSVTIAALAFYGLKWATPDMPKVQPGMQTVSTVDLKRSYDVAVSLDRAALELDRKSTRLNSSHT